MNLFVRFNPFTFRLSHPRPFQLSFAQGQSLLLYSARAGAFGTASHL